MAMMNKKGNSAVFLTVILSALAAVSLMLIYAVKENVIKSVLNSTVSLAGDSILSEFDENVQKEYGIFMMKGSDKELTEKLCEYVMYTMEDTEDVNIGDVEVSGGRFLMTDESEAERQILEYSKFLAAEKYKMDSEVRKEDAENDMMERTLRNGAAIASLPSSDLPKQSLTAMAESIADNVSDINKVFKEGTENFLFDSYITNLFNSRTNKISDKHFFKNEVEYILGGELSDEGNEQKVKMAVSAMRMPLNLIHIYSDSEKRNAVIAAAEALTPGAAAAATQLLIAAAWAYAETDNDIELLYQGYKVPVVKDRKTWAINIEDILNGISQDTVIPEENRGCDYGQYLRIMLFFQDRGIKTARILDLIQINNRAYYDKDFLVREHFTGIDIYVKANGKKYVYEKKY